MKAIHLSVSDDCHAALKGMTRQQIRVAHDQAESFDALQPNFAQWLRSLAADLEDALAQLDRARDF